MTPGRIAISGAGGLVGSTLAAELAASGAATVLRIARPGSGGEGAVPWDPAAGKFDAERLEGCDAVVHLAGEPIASGRWSRSRKAAIRGSRAGGTRLLVEGLGRLASKPRALICASAIGYYGDRGDEILTEGSAPGGGFLAQVVREWEEEAARASAHGIRVVSLRIGVVLAGRGGALPRMLLPFKLGLGGRLGTGRQWMSWIHIQDLVAIIRFALSREDLAGPINAVSPEPVTNASFTTALARTLGRPAVLPAPAFALKLALGEMAGELLLSSQRVIPKRLADFGHVHRFPRVDVALRQILEDR
ncbi:MAG TPA: TIGR01777 family oxidoreductase [Candidatus Polarisedimenticolia bacterium]|jgi:hypothetical protein